MFRFVIPAAVAVVMATQSMAGNLTDPMAVAQAANACGDRAILSAEYMDDGRIQVRCADGAVPVASWGGGLSTGAIVGAVVIAAAVAAASDGGSSTPDTQ